MNIIITTYAYNAKIYSQTPYGMRFNIYTKFYPKQNVL